MPLSPSIIGTMPDDISSNIGTTIEEIHRLELLDNLLLGCCEYGADL
jgi:hypothetical protein